MNFLIVACLVLISCKLVRFLNADKIKYFILYKFNISKKIKKKINNVDKFDIISNLLTKGKSILNFKITNIDYFTKSINRITI